MSEDREYKVGFGRPPLHSRFPPGQSGNPRGRKKGSRGLKTDLHSELASTLTIQINGKPFTGTKQQLILKALATRAAAGEVKAAALLLPLILQVFGIEDRGSEKGRLSLQDQALLDQLLSDIGAPPSIDPEHGDANPGSDSAENDPDDEEGNSG
jgi:hypothetical protein